MKKLAMLLLAVTILGTSCKKPDNNNVTPDPDPPTPTGKIEKTITDVAKVSITSSEGAERELTIEVAYIGQDTGSTTMDVVTLYKAGAGAIYGKEIHDRKTGAKVTIVTYKFSNTQAWTVKMVRKGATDTELLAVDGK